MKIVTDSVFLIVSECGNLVAKGTPRNRYICHLDEDDKKRFLTYSSKARADNAFEGSGFFLSDYTKQYIKDKLLCEDLYIIDDRGNLRKWTTIKKLIEESGYVVKDAMKTINNKRTRVSIITHSLNSTN